MPVVILRSLTKVLPGGQMRREEEAYTISRDAEPITRETDLFVDAS